MYWECKHITAFEDGLSIPRVSNEVLDVNIVRLEGHSIWRNILRTYSACKLTRSSDRLPALSGLVYEFARLMGLEADDYLAGVWLADLPQQLLWRC